MSSAAISLKEITKFGITPDDEALHPFNPGDETWQESYFFDWYNEDGTQAGHCRLGLYTGQDRIWLWFFLYDGDGWVAIEEPHLPLSILDRDTLSFDWQGLSFSYKTIDALQQGVLRVSGFGRVLNGTGAGRIVPVAAEVRLTATGAAHSIGQNTLKGHADESYSTSRYEQAISSVVTQKIGDAEVTFDARGERDHSWGPRMWNINWHFLVANGKDIRFQSTVVNLPGMDQAIKLGYLTRETTVNLTDVNYDLRYHDDNPWRSVEGTYRLETEDGEMLSGKIEPISGCEIDLTHSLTPPQQSLYRRTLVRCIPDDGGDSFVGWMEIHRMQD